MASLKIHTPEELRQLLRYEPLSGKLFWLPRHGDSKPVKIFNALFAGKEALAYRMGDKHLQGRVERRAYLAHRVIWAMVHGRWPTGEIDHINGNPIDNRIMNLRDIPKAENQRNMKRPKTNKSGVAGVCWQADRNMWRVRVKSHGREIHIGRFKTFGEAVDARKAALALHGFHPNHGRA